MKTKDPAVKCLVWDLDNTLWYGTLLEGDPVAIRPGVRTVLEKLDRRGILHSVASRNEQAPAMEKLQEFGLSDYFLYPQINWNSKAESIRFAAESLNFALDAMAFVDDQPFDRDEVSFALPEVMCIDAQEIEAIPDLPRMVPRFITEDSKLRRVMYLNDIRRTRAEQEFVGPSEAFLAGLNMIFTIAPATEDDLQRAEELTIRTHQLNTTGYTYSYDQLNAFRKSSQHRLLICGLEDKYGTYGKIGLCLLECHPNIWRIRLLLMSCRVMARGVGTIMLNHVMQLASKSNVRLQAEFVSNDRNRMMYITYKFAGFREISKHGLVRLLETDLTVMQPFPTYTRVEIRS
jgi:FkbH-like protein